MKTSSAKAKGRRLCQEVRDLLYKYAADLKPGDIEVTPSSCYGEDLKLSPAAREVYPFVIEGKNQEKLNIWDALEQAECHRPFSFSTDWLPVPVVFFRRNRSKMYVALEAESFVRLVR